MNLATALLKPGEADRHAAGHPWVFSNSILRLTGAVADGDVVQVKDHRQRLLGVGFYNSKSKISIRLLSPDRVNIDRAFFEHRLRSALAVRQKHLPEATSYRLVNGESDFLSGLIVDRYDDVLVLQTSSLGMDIRKAEIVSVLRDVLNPQVIIERNDQAARKFENLPVTNDVLFGDAPPTVPVSLNGLVFDVDLQAGHKTGLYLDQVANWQAVAKAARDAVVLDCFSFVGGFALHAARAGARSVLGLDQSADAIAAAQRNASVNGLAECCQFEAANVFDWLKARSLTGPHEKLVPQFDLIILDPPSFTRTRAAVPDALRGYKEIHLRALKLLKPGGTLATFCCSHHVNSVLFQEVILSAAFDARRILRRVATFSQALDHPVIPAIPETEYLKGFAFEAVR